MSESSPVTVRRSLHFVPGGNEHMFNKSLGLSADALILDLEDSVTADNKESARDAVCEWLQADFGRQQKLVRINAQDSPWGRDDLEAVVAARPDGLVLPKVSTRASVDAIEQILNVLETEHGLEPGSVELVLIATETPEAVFNLPQMARNRRINGVSWGAEDLSSALGARAKRDEQGDYLEVFSYVRSTCLLSAAAAEVQAIDAVYVDIENQAGLERECRRAADMGFRGKLTIHPAQIEIVNAAFTPTAEEVAEAQALVEAFAEAEQQGKLAFSWQGRLVDAPHLKQAREVLLLAERIKAITG
jgi:citrate lyase subunit beta/citryl-CoA lyase